MSRLNTMGYKTTDSIDFLKINFKKFNELLYKKKIKIDNFAKILGLADISRLIFKSYFNSLNPRINGHVEKNIIIKKKNEK